VAVSGALVLEVFQRACAPAAAPSLLNPKTLNPGFLQLDIPKKGGKEAGAKTITVS
jgi:hypothetical protein